jgi:transcription elongation factor GreA
MIMYQSEKLSLGEVAKRYFADLQENEKEVSQPEVLKFVRWFGFEASLPGLAASEIGNYAERLSLSDSDYINKLEMVRAFLTYTRNKGWCKVNLAIHLKPKKGKLRSKSSASRGQHLEVIPVTQEGYTKLKNELEELKLKRPKIIEEITKAAADKDFRENAPLEAAREQHGLIEGRIREIEATLKAAEIVDKKEKALLKVNVGDSVILVEVKTGEEMHYKIVGPRETDPSKGKISGVSPVGKAVVGHSEGETVDVIVPIGKISYQIKKILR